MAATPSGRDVHFDRPLSNIAIKAFQTRADYIGNQIFPMVRVPNQSDKYFIIGKDRYLLTPNTRRAPKTAPARIEFDVSSEGFFCDNFALASENAKEDLANADNALNLRRNSVSLVMDGLLRDQEIRIANKVTSLSNLGSGTTLSGTAQWSDFVNSSPLSDVTTAHAFIENTTGLRANTLVIDKDTVAVIRRHPELLDLHKHTTGGQVTVEQMRQAFDVDTVLIARGIKNEAKEAQTASITNIWGNIAILARVIPGVSLETQTFGLSFRWRPSNMQADMQVLRYDDPDRGKNVEIVSTQYFADEKIVAADLGYGIKDTI